MRITSSLHSIATSEDNLHPENVFRIPFTFTLCDGHFPLRDDPPQILRCCPCQGHHPLRFQRFFSFRGVAEWIEASGSSPGSIPLYSTTPVLRSSINIFGTPCLCRFLMISSRPCTTRPLPCRNTDPTKRTTYHTSESWD